MVSLLDFVHHIKFWLVESVSCISSIRLLLSVPVVTPARRDIAVADDAIAEIVGRNRHDHILNLACRPRIERSAHTAVADVEPAVEMPAISPIPTCICSLAVEPTFWIKVAKALHLETDDLPYRYPTIPAAGKWLMLLKPKLL